MGLNMILTGLQGVGGLMSIFSGNAARKRAYEAMQRLMAEMGTDAYNEVEQLRQRNAEGLWAATGTAGDAIRALGANLGAGMAAGGVYNSTGTAGALERATEASTGQLAGLAATNRYNEQSLLADVRKYLASQKLGLLKGEMARGEAQAAGGAESLSSLLGSTVQNMLANQNVPSNNIGPAMNGNYNSVLRGGQDQGYLNPTAALYGYNQMFDPLYNELLYKKPSWYVAPNPYAAN